MADLLQQLLPMSWRGVAFPVSNLTTEFDHAQADHATPDVDGARIESTGRNPVLITAHIPFRNGVLPGPNETWTAGLLYPNAYREFMTAFADRSTGDLVHPSLGTLRCKPKSFKSSLTATARDGEDVDVTWRITNEDDEDALTAPSPLPDAIAAAVSLDSNLPVVARANGLPDNSFGDPFGDLVSSITSVSDSAQLLSRRMGASVDRQLARVQQVRDSLSGLKGVAKANAVRDANRLESALNAVKKTLLVNRQVHVHTVERTTTLAALTGQLGNKITDLIRLNRDLVRLPMVPAQSIVHYYKAA